MLWIDKRTWHSVSSGRLLHVWRQATLAAQEGLAMHFASSILTNYMVGQCEMHKLVTKKKSECGNQLKSAPYRSMFKKSLDGS